MARLNMRMLILMLLLSTTFLISRAVTVIYPYPTFVVDNIRYYVLNIGETKSAFVAPHRDYTDPDLNARIYVGRIEIPDSVESEGVVYPVVGLYDCAFYDCINLEELILPETLNRIWRKSLYGCGELTLRIHGPLEMDYEVLCNTAIRQPFELPEIITTSNYLFASLPWLEKFRFKKLTNIIYDYTFAGSNIREIEFEDDPQDTTGARFCLYNRAFGNSEIEEVRLPDRRLGFGNDVFYNSTALKKIIFSSGKEIRLLGNTNRYQEGSYRPELLIKDCPNLQEIICESPEPPIFREHNFPDFRRIENHTIIDDNSQVFLRVPSGSERLYAEDPIWGQFVNISDLEGNIYRSTAVPQIGTVEGPTLNRIMADGKTPTIIRSEHPVIVTVYNLYGVELCREQITDGEFSILLPRGMYIVRQSPAR